MKYKQHTIIAFILSALALIGVVSTSHAQTRAEIERSAIKEIDELNRKHVKEFQEMVKKKEAERLAIEKGDPITILKEIYAALISFEADFGSFPDESNIDSNDDFQVVNHLAKNSSNRYFGLILASGHSDAKSETHFSLAFDAIKVEKADNVVAKGKMLEAGECSITYNRGLSVVDYGPTPLALYPVTPGKMCFDATAAGGKAYVLSVDGAVKVYDVAADGSVMVDGKSFFDPAQPFWGGKMNLCYPLIKQQS